MQQGKASATLRQIVQRFNGTEFDHRGFTPHTHLLVDMLLMIHAHNFIGNPGPTLSLNVARVRRYALGAERAATNIGRSCEGVNMGQKEFLHGAGWESEFPLD